MLKDLFATGKNFFFENWIPFIESDSDVLGNLPEAEKSHFFKEKRNDEKTLVRFPCFSSSWKVTLGIKLKMEGVFFERKVEENKFYFKEEARDDQFEERLTLTVL